MKVTRTLVFEGQTELEYSRIVAHLETEAQKKSGWVLKKEPEKFCVTAEKFEEVDAI